MFKKKEEEKVILLEDVPQSNVGAPLPCLVASENDLYLSYIMNVPDPNWDGTYVNVVGLESQKDIAIVRFSGAFSHFFGPPNDEAFEGHPLSRLGLKPYSVSRIEGSSWIKELIKRNSVHPQHSPNMLSEHSHYIFAFHDTTFECIAKGFTVQKFNGSMNEAILEMARNIAEHDS
jgi:hypothetical protein